MSDASLSARMPKGDANGIGPIVKALISEPETVHALLVLVNTKTIKTDVDTGETIPIMRIRRIEAIRPSDMAEAQRLIQRAWEDRNGSTVLPIELEDDIEALFRDVNKRADDALGLNSPDKNGGEKKNGPDFSDGPDGSE